MSVGAVWVLPLQLRPQRGRPVEVLAVGAHADDIEIGAGGAIRHLPAAGLPLYVTWVVLAAAGVREREAVASAAAFLKDVEQTTAVRKSFRDGFFFPWRGLRSRRCSRTPRARSTPTW